jgi:hypothetical protein
MACHQGDGASNGMRDSSIAAIWIKIGTDRGRKMILVRSDGGITIDSNRMCSTRLLHPILSKGLIYETRSLVARYGSNLSLPLILFILNLIVESP